MRYASEKLINTLCIAHWKPIPNDQFALLLHLLARENCDDLGQGGVPHMETCKLDDRVNTATVWYSHKNDKKCGVYSPRLLTMTSGTAGNAKVHCYSYIDTGYDPQAPLEISEDAAKA